MLPKMNHLLITGPPGVGKTTLLQHALQQLKDVPTHGFFTEEVRVDGRRVGFDVVTLSGGRAPLARVGGGGGGGRRPTVGPYAVDVASLERTALPALAAAAAGSLLVIDEVGKMELLSAAFQRAVRAAFVGGAAAVLATVPVARGRQAPLLAELRARKDVQLLEVSRENRDALVERVVEFARRRAAALDRAAAAAPAEAGAEGGDGTGVQTQ